MCTDVLQSTFTLLFADLLLSHKLLRNDFYAPRVVSVFLAVRWVLHSQVCNLQDYFFVTSFPLFFSLPFCDFKQTPTADAWCFQPATRMLSHQQLLPWHAYILYGGSTLAPLTPPMKLQQLSFNMESSISGGL